MSNLVELNEQNFEQEVLDSDQPVIVDFFANWCGPCRMMAPVFKELSEEFEGRLKFGKVNTENSRRLASMYSIRSIPNLKIFKNGRVVDEIIGFAPREQLKQIIQQKLR